jgi:hypothetical protein
VVLLWDDKTSHDKFLFKTVWLIYFQHKFALYKSANMNSLSYSMTLRVAIIHVFELVTDKQHHCVVGLPTILYC